MFYQRICLFDFFVAILNGRGRGVMNSGPLQVFFVRYQPVCNTQCTQTTVSESLHVFRRLIFEYSLMVISETFVDNAVRAFAIQYNPAMRISNDNAHTLACAIELENLEKDIAFWLTHHLNVNPLAALADKREANVACHCN